MLAVVQESRSRQNSKDSQNSARRGDDPKQSFMTLKPLQPSSQQTQNMNILVNSFTMASHEKEILSCLRMIESLRESGKKADFEIGGFST
jgi:hypothetical protein